MASTPGWLKERFGGAVDKVEGWGQDIGSRLRAGVDAFNAKTDPALRDSLRAQKAALASPPAATPQFEPVQDRPRPTMTVNPQGQAYVNASQGVRPPAYNPAVFQSTRTGQIETTRDLSQKPSLRAAQAQPTGGPAWGKGPSPEAKAFMADRAAGGGGYQPPTTPPSGKGATPDAPKYGRIGNATQKLVDGTFKAIPGGGLLRKAANATGRLGPIGGAIAGLGAYDAASAGDTVEQRAGGSALRGGIAEFGDNMLLGYGRELGTAAGGAAAGFTQGRGIRGRIGGAIEGAKLGWADARAAEDAISPPTEGSVFGQPPTPAQPPAPVAGSVGDEKPAAPRGGFVRTGDHDADYRNATMYLLEQGVPPEQIAGYGQQGSGVRGGAAPGGDPMAGALRGLRDGIGKEGPLGAMAALQIAGNLSGMKTQAETRRDTAVKSNTDAGLRAAQIKTTGDYYRGILGQNERAAARKAESDSAESFDKDIESMAIEMAGEPGVDGDGKLDPTHEGKVNQLKSSLRNDIKYSLGNRKDGKSFGQLNGTERQQLFLAKKFKDGVVGAREGWTQEMRDYFGPKRFNTRDLYSYIPTKVERSSLPGSSYVVHFPNGNTAEVGALTGGGFKWLGPNEPIDADMMEMIQPLIEQANKKGK